MKHLLRRSRKKIIPWDRKDSLKTFDDGKENGEEGDGIISYIFHAKMY